MSVAQLRAVMGKVNLPNPLLLASGVRGASLSEVTKAPGFGAGAAVTKSIGPEKREGYPEPTLASEDSGLVNAAGLPNPGAEAFSRELESVNGLHLPILVSIFGGSDEEFVRVTDILDDRDFIAFELNLSCPHVAGVGTEIGHDPAAVAAVVRTVKSKTSKPVFAKLSPNTENLIEVAQSATGAGVDELTAVNTVRAISIDVASGRPSLSNVYGGLSGGAIRPIALRCVYELRDNFDVPILGCGGVSTWEHAVQFLLAGANAVQLGTAAIADPAIYNDINLGILS
ncbi:MAG: dihydroorotate dehydrogenase [Thaumarchaeota archaeon]|nr:dihydroorotate dehydrogenase [Nitrososphaerota archaeon]